MSHRGGRFSGRGRMPPSHGKDTPYGIAGDTPHRHSGPGRWLRQHPGQQRFGRYAAHARALRPARAHGQRGTNRLSVVALGLMGTIGFHSEGLVDWRRGGRIAVLVALGTIVGSFVAVEFSEALLDAIVIAGLLLVLGMLLV